LVPVELRQDFQIWKRYQERQFVKLSIYSLWHVLVQMLDSCPFSTASAQQVLNHYQEAFGNSPVARKWLGRDYRSSDVRHACKSLRGQWDDKPGEFGNVAITLADALRDLHQTPPERIGTAVVLLLLVSSYWTECGKEIEESQLHRDGGRDRLSLDAVSSDVNRMEAAALSDYVQWAVESYVLKQATRIALEKLPDYRFFVVRDDNGYRLVKRQRPLSYLSYDSSRIESAFALMSELKLMKLSETYTLTALGRKVLQRLRAHHGQSGAPE
jgi:hypothetical protein